MITSEFKKGFATGVALKSIPFYFEYAPSVWNDSGIYTYFYIDFLRPVNEFSLGKLRESIFVYTTEVKSIQAFERVSERLYRFYCDFSDGINGVCVINVASSLLEFSANNTKMKEFSVGFKPSGMSRNSVIPYLFEQAEVSLFKNEMTENVLIDISEENILIDVSEKTDAFEILSDIDEQVTTKFTEGE